MPNNVFPSVDPNSLKASAGGSSNVSADSLQTNPFIANDVINVDQNSTFQTNSTVSNFGTDIPQQNQSTSLDSSGLDSIIQQNFAPSNNASGSTSVLNRDSATTLNSTLATNFGSVQSDATNTFTSTTVPATTTNITSSFSNNILGNYDNITYNFKLMLAPESALISNTTIPTTNLYVIAQSGVTTSFNIKDVEIDSIVAPNDRTKNTLSTIFRIKLIETQGISLIDKIFQAASVMGIKNIMNCPMILELTFRGYTQSGEPIEVNIATRTWRLQLIDMPTKLDIGGSEYDMNFISINDYGFHRFSSASIIKQQLSLAVNTVGEFFNSLGYYLTIQDALIASKGIQSRNEYAFVVQSDMKSWVIGQAQSKPNAPSMFVDTNGKRSVVMKPGHKLEDIIDNVLATTKEANKLANPKSDPTKMDQPQDGSTISKIFNVSCETSIIGFNQSNNEYIRKFTYYINVYDAFRALPDKPDASDQPQRISYLLSDGLRKAYQYIFTGQNTEVLNLNLELNNLWRHATTYYTQAMHRVNNNSSDFLKEVPVDLTNIDDLRVPGKSPFETNANSNNTNTSSNVFGAGVSQTVNPDFAINNTTTASNPTPQSDSLQLQQRLQQLQQSPNVNTTALQETLSSLDTANQITPIEGPQTTSQIPGLNSIPQASQLVSSTLNRITTPTQTGPLNLIETLPNSTLANPLLNMFIKQVDPALDVNRVNENIEMTTDTSRSIFGIIANQMYAGTYTDLLQIDLEVRGDPFWLGETDSEVINRLQAGNSRTAGTGNFANYLRGENSFFLTFKTPKNYNDSTGFVDLEESTTFMGVYNVVSVIHTFSGGKFTQKLNAIRDINTDPQTIKSYVQ